MARRVAGENRRDDTGDAFSSNLCIRSMLRALVVCESSAAHCTMEDDACRLVTPEALSEAAKEMMLPPFSSAITLARSSHKTMSQ